MVLDYPSRLDKYEMEIITDEAQIKKINAVLLLNLLHSYSTIIKRYINH
jgi:hypothetical protein